MLSLGYEGFLVCELSPQNDRELLLDDIIKPRTMFKNYEKVNSQEKEDENNETKNSR